MLPQTLVEQGPLLIRPFDPLCVDDVVQVLDMRELAVLRQLSEFSARDRDRLGHGQILAPVAWGDQRRCEPLLHALGLEIGLFAQVEVGATSQPAIRSIPR